MVYAPGAPRRQIVPRSMYQGQPTQQAPQALPSAPGAAPGAVRGPPGRNYAPLNAPAGLNNARPVAPARAPGALTPVAAGVTPRTVNPQAEGPGVHPVTAVNAFGAVGATPGATFQQDPEARKNVITSGGFRQERPSNERSYAPFDGGVGSQRTERGDGATPNAVRGHQSKLAGPRPTTPEPTETPAGPVPATPTPTATGSSAVVSTTDGTDANSGVGTSGSGLTTAPGATDKDGNPIEEEGPAPSDNAGEALDEYGFNSEQRANMEQLWDTVALSSGEDKTTIEALMARFRREHPSGTMRFDVDEDTGQITGVSGTERWLNPETGQYEDREWDADIEQIDLNRARGEGEKLATSRGGNGGVSDDEFNKLVEEMKNLGQSPEDKKALEDQIAIDRQRNEYETSRALVAGMEGGARSGLSADASSGRAADLQLRGGLAGAEQESRTRLEASKQRVENQLRAIQLQVAMVGQKMSHEQQIEIMKLQTRLQKQYAAYADALATPNVGEAVGSVFGNIFGSGLNLLTFGGANAIAKSIWG